MQQITWERERSVRLLGLGVRLFLAASLTASQTPGGYAPFALGAVAASGSGAEGAAALLGTLIGALIFLEFGEALPFLAVGLLLLATATAFRDTVFSGRLQRFLPMLAAGIFLSVEGIYVVQSLEPMTRVAPCLAAAILVGSATYFYQPLLLPGQEHLTPEGLFFLGASLLLALEDLSLLGISLGRCALCTLLLATAYGQGAMTGAAAGLGIGLVTDLCAGSDAALFTAVYGLAGLVAGSRQARNRSVTALSFLTSGLVVLLPVHHALTESLFLEMAAGSILFLLLPKRCFGGKRIARSLPTEGNSPGLERMKAQLNRTASALRELYDSMTHSAPPSTDENPAIIFDRAAEKVCRGCALCDLCWQKEYTGTFNALNDATPYLLERGRALGKDFPQYFSDRCIHLPDFLGAVNGELSAFLLRRQYRRQLEETRRSARGQYAQLSELLTATAAGLGKSVAAVGGAEAARVGAALRPRKGESACGDTLVSFHTETGLLCLLLADGMGSGESARKESALACRLMRQFLEAGIEPEAALKTLNSAMALRGADTGSFTTIDLLTCREETGEAALYKYGAAPSYLKKGGVVRRITGGTLPAGLRGSAALPDVTHVTLERGSFAVLISDGVADPNEDEWLQNLLAGWEGEDPQVLAGLILQESIRREGLADDCGIQVLYLPQRPVKKV